MFGSFFLGAVCSIGSILVTTLSTPEDPPSPEELALLRAAPRGLTPFVRDIADAVRAMPASLHKLGLVYLFQWYAIVIYWQYVSVVVAKSVFNTTAENKEVYSNAVALTGLLNGFYNVITFCSAFYLVTLARRYGAKWVHAGCLTLAAIALVIFPHITNQYLLFAPMIGLGIAWASMMGVPYIMVVSMVPKERYGVYMGIVNMMIVVPMLIESVTFGFIFKNFLGDDPINAMMFSGVLFGIAAIAMTWIRPPKRQSPVVPLTFRQIMGYERVIVVPTAPRRRCAGWTALPRWRPPPRPRWSWCAPTTPLPAREQAKLVASVGPVHEECPWGVHRPGRAAGVGRADQHRPHPRSATAGGRRRARRGPSRSGRQPGNRPHRGRQPRAGRADGAVCWARCPATSPRRPPATC